MSALPTIAINIEAVLSRHAGRPFAHIIRHLACAGFPDARVRDSLHSLCNHGRVTRTGKRCKYLYWLTDKATPRPADELRALRPEVLRSAANDLHAAGAGVAIPPVWPAPPVRQRLDRNPIWRIAA